MTARDELVTILSKVPHVRALHLELPASIVTHAMDGIAEAILAAGYYKPRTITTVEELDELPDAVLVLTEQGGYWESIKRMDRKNWWHEPGSTNVSPSEDLTLPATVLHEGAQS